MLEELLHQRYFQSRHLFAQVTGPDCNGMSRAFTGRSRADKHTALGVLGVWPHHTPTRKCLVASEMQSNNHILPVQTVALWT